MALKLCFLGINDYALYLHTAHSVITVYWQQMSLKNKIFTTNLWNMDQLSLK